MQGSPKCRGNRHDGAWTEKKSEISQSAGPSAEKALLEPWGYHKHRFGLRHLTLR